MPDWSYRTVFRPLFFRLPPAAARDIALGVIGGLARLPLGPAVIDILGHMSPDPRLRRSLLGMVFPTAVGLGAGIDAKATALPALARFGFGFLEVGPVTTQARAQAPALERRPDQQAIWYPDPPANLGVAALARGLSRVGPLGIPLAVRLGCAPGTPAAKATDECRRMVVELAPYADLLCVATAALAAADAWSAGDWEEHLRAVHNAVREAPAPCRLLVSVPPDLDSADLERLVGMAAELGVGGVVIEGAVRTPGPGRLLGPPAREPALRTVRWLRQRWGHLALISSGGIHEPEQALEFVQAGADLVQIDTGLVYAGPGLPKRVNDALLFAGTRAGATELPLPPASTAAEMSWFWTLLLGVSMLAGGLLALAIAATQVVLPYDEAFVGMTRAQLVAVNPRLLAFMTHDRVTLAGTMIAVGVLYTQLSLFGIRRGLHWARVAVLTSAFSGFASFFLFLGFGYFEPFHAFVTAVLFPVLLLGLHARLGPPPAPTPPNLREDWRWRLSLWGQLLLIVQGAVLVVAGFVICTVGVTKVFVPEDLEFMGTTAAALAAANPRLLPLVAHDRASFGGMLVACGLAVLLSALWGYRQGARWLWWMLLLSGTAGYGAALAVHLAVGYTNRWHLAPAFAGALALAAGLGLSYPYLQQRSLGHVCDNRQ